MPRLASRWLSRLCNADADISPFVMASSEGRSSDEIFLLNAPKGVAEPLIGPDGQIGVVRKEEVLGVRVPLLLAGGYAIVP
ncbi:hypothetical protein TMatcc_003433 [Talaromyces marneffei ATCC 18224]